MPVQFTPAQVEAVARLAQLDLTPDEIELFARQLGEFLDYATDVLAVDTTGVEPTAIRTKMSLRSCGMPTVIVKGWA